MVDWREQLRREASEMEKGVRAALALGSDEAVRVELERLSMLPQFGGFTWLWLPAVAKRNRVMFRPLMLSLFDRNAMDGSGKIFDAWKGASGAALQAVLDEVDAADDIELTKRLYSWRLEGKGTRDTEWRADVVRRFKAAATPSARFTALAKVDGGSWWTLDVETALALWHIDGKSARAFIIAHLPWRADLKTWRPLLDATRTSDPDFYFDVYRRIVDSATWRADLLALPASGNIVDELEKRHPRQLSEPAAPVFHELLVRHGAPVIAYVKKHLDIVQPRWTWYGRTQGKGLSELLELATEQGWLDLWAALLRTSATRELFDAEVKKLVKAGDVRRLSLLPGRGTEVHGAGFSFAFTHQLDDTTACELYAKYPALVRGPFRVHVTPLGWAQTFPKLVAAVIAAGDDDFVDFLASRLVTRAHVHDNDTKNTLERLVALYGRLPKDVRVQRAARVLSRAPAFGVFSYKHLIEQNALARSLFESDLALYLGDSAAVRDLLESPQIFVQLLAFRVLGLDDERARAMAAEHIDLVQATLFRRMRVASRKLGLAALRQAALHDETTATYVLGRLREAMAMPERRYPTEEVVGVIGAVLHRWPALRGAREQPVIYRREAMR